MIEKVIPRSEAKTASPILVANYLSRYRFIGFGVWPAAPIWHKIGFTRPTFCIIIMVFKLDK